MDRFIQAMPAVQDGDLMICREHGIAYQADRMHRVAYDAAYFDKCSEYEGNEIALKVTAGRVAMVNRHVGPNRVLDIGIGSGEFIKARPNTFGHDVNPVAIEWLRGANLWAEVDDGFAGYTMFDVIEHVETPEDYLRHIPLQAFAFFSVPIVYGIGAVRLSKHYRPGEHLQHWTLEGFVAWMGMHGFMLLEKQDFEIQAGRESIYTFAFRRYRWPSS